MPQTLYILQGLPGSGKSTLAKQMMQGREPVLICSTDDFFWVGEQWIFDPAKLGEYHEKNQQDAREFMADGCTVIVDNTNLQCWEAKPYVVNALRLGIPVVFVRVTGNFKSTHGVPPEVIEKMRLRMEDLTVEKVLASVKPNFSKVVPQ